MLGRVKPTGRRGRCGSVRPVRLAFSTLANTEGSLADAAAAGVRYGYEGIELRIVDGRLLTPEIAREERRAIVRTIGATGLAICCVDTSFEIANPREPVATGLAYVDLAADLGAPMIRLFGGAPSGEPWSTTVARTGERAEALAERGRALGVTVAIETHDTFAAGAALARALELAPDDVGVVWDTLNPMIVDEPPARTFERVRERLVHVHVKDGGVPPDRERNELLGHGRVPVADIVRMLREDGYDGWLSVEWEKRWQPSIPAADVALPQYAAALREILAG